jgi:hypothetical protein
MAGLGSVSVAGSQGCVVATQPHQACQTATSTAGQRFAGNLAACGGQVRRGMPNIIRSIVLANSRQAGSLRQSVRLAAGQRMAAGAGPPPWEGLLLAFNQRWMDNAPLFHGIGVDWYLSTASRPVAHRLLHTGTPPRSQSQETIMATLTIRDLNTHRELISAPCLPSGAAARPGCSAGSSPMWRPSEHVAGRELLRDQLQLLC